MIETIAKVRSITRQDGKLSAVIELINLDDHQIDEMARLTNEMIVNKKTPQYKDIHSAARQTTGVSRAIV